MKSRSRNRYSNTNSDSYFPVLRVVYFCVWWLNIVEIKRNRWNEKNDRPSLNKILFDEWGEHCVGGRPTTGMDKSQTSSQVIKYPYSPNFRSTNTELFCGFNGHAVCIEGHLPVRTRSYCGYLPCLVRILWVDLLGWIYWGRYCWAWEMCFQVCTESAMLT